MLSASILSGCRGIVSMLSPAKNPCRIRVAPIGEAAAASASWYRYDPYASKVLPSPMKTLPSPTAPRGVSMAAAAASPEAQRNSLFTAPSPAAAATVAKTVPKPRSFLAAAAKEAASQVATATNATNSASVASTSTPKKSAVTHYAIIHFKHESATFVAPFRVAAGDHVFVQGDRGEDVGRVGEVFTETPSYPVPQKIVRRASQRDMQAFAQKAKKETETVSFVQNLAGTLGLSLDVVDTEFQFDMNKLTVFFNANAGHTDFRKLQRGLFREFRCRIWLSNMAEVEYNAAMQKTRRTR